MIFALWFLSCQYWSRNPLFNILSPRLSLSSLLFRWVPVNMWIIPFSRELLSPSALPSPCTPLYDSAIRFEMAPPLPAPPSLFPFSLWVAVIVIKEKKAVCPERRASCSGVPWHSLFGSSGCCWLEPYGDKSNVTGDWGLWSLSGFHSVHYLGLTRSLLTLLASRELSGCCVQETFILLSLGSLVIQRCVLQPLQ